MSTFLDIPRELREMIVEHALRDHRLPPESPLTQPQPERVELRDINRRAQNSILHEKDQSRIIGSLALLLTNRQLSRDTKSVLARLGRLGRLSYALDVMLVNEVSLWPTWTSFPTLATHLESVTVTFRLFGSGGSGWRGGGSGPPSNTWVFYYFLLDTFFCHGLGLADLHSDTKTLPDRKVTVRTLTLDVLTPLPSGDEVQQQLHTPNARRRTVLETTSQLDPVLLEGFMRRNISSLLSMGYHTAEYGGFLYEQIGTIRFCLGGKLKEEINLAEALAQLRRIDPDSTFGHLRAQEDRVPEFWGWKASALRMRGEAGLPVVVPDDPELKEYA